MPAPDSHQERAEVDDGALLSELARRLQELAAATDPELSLEASRVADRLQEGSFHIVVLGEFKRGKSTLINALLGHDILPTGVLPLTAVSIQVRYGTSPPKVCYTNGMCEELPQGQSLRDVATEEGNPGNHKNVEFVTVQTESQLLAPGLVLVDSPGIGSVHRHNDEQAAVALERADGAIVVLSATEPLSMAEANLLSSLAEKDLRIFVVVNKSDYLSQEELAEVRSFLVSRVRDLLGRDERLWFISAKEISCGSALNQLSDLRGLEYKDFEEELWHFVEHDLIAERHRQSRHQLSRIARNLEESLQVLSSLALLEQSKREQTLRLLEEAAELQRRAWQDDVTLCKRDVSQLMDELHQELQAFSRDAPRRYLPRLEALARTCDRSSLEENLTRAIEESVTQAFEEFRVAQATKATTRWEQIALATKARAEQHVNELRDQISKILGISLEPITIPDLRKEPTRFSYHFLQIEGTGALIASMSLQLLPGAIRRRVLLTKARRRLWDEFDKHAGRSREDLWNRLQSASSQLEHQLGNAVSRGVSLAALATERLKLQQPSLEARSFAQASRDRLLAELVDISASLQEER